MNCTTCNKTFDWQECGVDSDQCRTCLHASLLETACQPRSKLCSLWNCRTCFLRTVAALEKCKYWDYKRNAPDYPIDVLKGSDKKFWFKCPCGHSFDISPSNLAMGKWCPYCSKIPKRLCAEDCEQCHTRSLASHPRADLWDAVRNCMPARAVFRTSNKPAWFRCKCGHSFNVLISQLKNCTYCEGTGICDDECDQCWKKSFASHPRAAFWSNQNKVNPRNVHMNCNRKYWFACSCGHEIHLAPGTIVSQDVWCGYCAGKRLCEGVCQMCADMSFASHPRATFWHERNAVTPRDVFRRAPAKYWFRCAAGHEFEAAPDNVSGGKWCPKCKNKTEALIEDFLQESGIEFTRQPRFDWCRNVLCLPFDFEVGDQLIECDGAQHFRDVAAFRSTAAMVRTRDVKKMRDAFANGRRVIRISQEDIWSNAFDWRHELAQALTNSAQVQWLASDTCVYDAHKTDLVEP